MFHNYKEWKQEYKKWRSPLCNSTNYNNKSISRNEKLRHNKADILQDTLKLRDYKTYILQ